MGLLACRTVAVTADGRTTFQFDPATWAAIDKLAAKLGTSWQDWAARAIARLWPRRC